jgi:hypothetical protein
MNLLKKYKESIISFVCGVALITGLIIIWEVAAAHGWEYANIFPPPSRFLKQLSDDGYKIGLGSQSASINSFKYFESAFRAFLRSWCSFLLWFFRSIKYLAQKIFDAFDKNTCTCCTRCMDSFGTCSFWHRKSNCYFHCVYGRIFHPHNCGGSGN